MKGGGIRAFGKVEEISREVRRSERIVKAKSNLLSQVFDHLNNLLTE